jgi:hypothetical protein
MTSRFAVAPAGLAQAGADLTAFAEAIQVAGFDGVCL